MASSGVSVMAVVALEDVDELVDEEADEAEEVKPEHVLIIEKVTPTECIVQPHSIKQSFGIIRSEAYMDTPFTLRTESIVACLGAYPERGDILQQNGIGCMVTELAGYEDGVARIKYNIGKEEFLLREKVFEEEIERIAAECSRHHSRTIGSFKTLDHDDIVAIYKACR